MVDRYGRWTYEECTPDSKKCDMDIVAVKILSDGYKPKTSIENLVTKIIIMYDEARIENNSGTYALEDNRPDGENLMIFLDDLVEYVRDSGGYNEFDYTA